MSLWACIGKLWKLFSLVSHAHTLATLRMPGWGHHYGRPAVLQCLDHSAQILNRPLGTGFRGTSDSEPLGHDCAHLLSLFFHKYHRVHFDPQLKFPDDFMFLFSSTFFHEECLFVYEAFAVHFGNYNIINVFPLSVVFMMLFADSYCLLSMHGFVEC